MFKDRRNDDGALEDEYRAGTLTGDDATDIVRSEEQLVVQHNLLESGKIRVKKHVVSEAFEAVDERGIEHATIERVPADEGDSGEVEHLEDGSVSIPVLEEELVVTKRVVVRERIIIHKQTEYEPVDLRADLRHEEVEIEVDESVDARVSGVGE